MSKNIEMWRARYTRGSESGNGHTGLTIDLFESRREMERAVLRLLIEVEASMKNRPRTGETRRWHLFRQWFKSSDEEHRDRSRVYGCVTFHGLDRLVDGEWVEHAVHVTEPELVVGHPANLAGTRH